MKTLLVSAAALIDAQERILLAQRPEGKSMAGLWEFPGGKVEPNETPEAALTRELQEELAITPTDMKPLTFASHSYDNFHLIMPLFLCQHWKGTPAPQEGQKIAWANIKELASYPMPPADEPLVTFLKNISLSSF